MGAPTEGRGRLQVLLSVRKPKSKVGLSSARLEVVVFLLTAARSSAACRAAPSRADHFTPGARPVSAILESKQFPTGRRSLPLRVLGAGRADGRGPSIWDKFSSVPVVVAGGDTGDVAAGHYHRWPYAIRILVDLGVDSYGLSVSWLRVSPRDAEGSNDGGPVFTAGWSGAENGIDPFLTLCHWDTAGARG
jgi:hypothetical protein